ncbi:hypothetical protein EXS54_01740 [Patescibacteria group bacterium]|nr:hypothetical protein [Patescibacteria group bacterium]
MDPEETRLIKREEPTDSPVERLVAENHEDVFQLENDPRFIEISLRNVDLCQGGLESIVQHAANSAVLEHEQATALSQRGAGLAEIEERKKRAGWFEQIAKKEEAPAAAYHELEAPISAQLAEAQMEALEAGRLALEAATEKPSEGVLRERLHNFVQSEAKLYRVGEALHDLQSVTAGAAAPDFRKLAIQSDQEAERLEGIAAKRVEELTDADLTLTQRLAESRLVSGSEGAATPLLAAEHTQVQEEITAIRTILAKRTPIQENPNAA